MSKLLGDLINIIAQLTTIYQTSQDFEWGLDLEP